MAANLVIGYLTSVYARATDTFVRNEVGRLRELGHTVHTFSIRRPDPDQLVSDEVRREHDSTTYILPDHSAGTVVALLTALVTRPGRTCSAAALAWRTGPKGIRGRVWALAYLAEAAFLAGRLRALGVQHLHNHLGESSATVAMLAAEIAGIPYSVAIHGPYIFRAPERWALGEKIARSSFTACITDFTRSQCMIHAPAEAWDRLHVVRCAPEPRFLEEEPAPISSAKRLVWVGRVCEEKGVPLLVEAAERLAAEGAEFELVLFGDGPLRRSLEASLPERGLAGHVRFAGWAKSDRVRTELADSRALVLPSFAEGLPVVLMEALALGRPVISTYVAGIPELVDSDCGWIVPAGSVDALVDALRELLSSPTEDLERLGRNGRERVRVRHDVATEVAKLEGLIRASVNGSA